MATEVIVNEQTERGAWGKDVCDPGVLRFEGLVDDMEGRSLFCKVTSSKVGVLWTGPTPPSRRLRFRCPTR